jgi:Na+-driven multidrug efflux pump
MGKPDTAALGSFVALYLIGIPVGTVLCFENDLYLHGLWYGTISGLLFLVLFY